MKLLIDTLQRQIICEEEGNSKIFPLYSRESFEMLSSLWLQVGWNQKYTYTFSWLGRPIIQLPEDMIRVQEVIFHTKPDVIIETGVAHGGSLVFYASLCKLIGKGRVIGIDVEIRPHNRKAIEAHELSSWITLIENNSVAPEVVETVRSHITENDSVLVLLDSNHTKEHVLKELNTFHQFVTPGSYIVATDGIMKDLTDVPRGRKEWSLDNPYQAALEFIRSHPEFSIVQPDWIFNESELEKNVTHWPGAWLKKSK